MARTILIADDDVLILKVLRVRLEAEGFEVVTSRDAYHALEVAIHQKPDLLLLDVNMPAGDGFSVHARLTRMQDLATTPVIYITADSPESVEERADALGAFAVIHKPIDTKALVQMVRAALAPPARGRSGVVAIRPQPQGCQQPRGRAPAAPCSGGAGAPARLEAPPRSPRSASRRRRSSARPGLR